MDWTVAKRFKFKAYEPTASVRDSSGSGTGHQDCAGSGQNLNNPALYYVTTVNTV